MIIQKNTTINIRTPEEWNAFTKIGHAEGLKWAMYNGKLYERAIVIGGVYIRDDFKALTSPFDYKNNDSTKIVEASDLFHNHIISMRLRGG